MKIFCLCMCVSFSCFAADPSFGGTSKERYKKMKKEVGPEKPRISPLQGPYLMGDWEGLRSKLASKGIMIRMGYATNLVENILGGEKRGFGYAGSFSVDANVDIGKQTSLKGLSFYTYMKIWKVGHQPARSKNLELISCATSLCNKLYGRGLIQFNECYLRGEFFDKALTFKVGCLNGGNDFLQLHLYY